MASEVLIFTGFIFLIVNAGTTQIAELHSGPPEFTAFFLLLLGAFQRDLADVEVVISGIMLSL